MDNNCRCASGASLTEMETNIAVRARGSHPAIKSDVKTSTRGKDTESAKVEGVESETAEPSKSLLKFLIN